MSPAPVIPSLPIPRQMEVYVFERGLWSRGWFMVLLCLVFVALDWELVPARMFPFVFVFPVMLVAWNRSLLFAVINASVLSLVRIFHQFVFLAHPVVSAELGDALIRFLVLVLLAALTSQLGRLSRQLRHQVHTLEGILPICSFCKRIRAAQDNWVQMEEYISGHSDAQFSHSLCPDCLKQQFGEFLPKN